GGLKGFLEEEELVRQRPQNIAVQRQRLVANLGQAVGGKHGYERGENDDQARVQPELSAFAEEQFHLPLQNRGELPEARRRRRGLQRLRLGRRDGWGSGSHGQLLRVVLAQGKQLGDGIDAVLGQQLLVGAATDQPPLVEKGDRVAQVE